MSRATAKARQILSSYYANRAIVDPADEAREFIGRVTIRKDGVWTHPMLEDTAAGILSRCILDIDDLVENNLHIPLQIRPLQDLDSKAGATVFGYAVPEGPEIVICERAERYLPLYRTSLAHELGHIMLHGNYQKEQMCYAPAAQARPKCEHEADEFMIALLAPQAPLLLATGLAASAAAAPLEDVLLRANTKWGHYVWKTWILPILIDRLCLSRLFLLVTFKQMKIINQQTLEYHSSYALPNRWRQ